MDFAASEKNFAILIAVAAFVVFWFVWSAMTWEAPIEGRLPAVPDEARLKELGERWGLGSSLGRMCAARARVCAMPWSGLRA